MTGGTTCVRMDEDKVRGGFVFTSTIPGNDDSIFYTYGEVHHFLERVQLGYFAGVEQIARERNLMFGPTELTPQTAEFAAPDYAAQQPADIRPASTV